MSIYRSVRAFVKKYFDRIRNEKVKINLLQAIPFWFASIITGLIAVLYAKLFALAEHIPAILNQIGNWYILLLTPICFIISWWIVKKFSPFARGSGIPQVMAAIELSNSKNNPLVEQLLNLKVIFTKVISSLVLVAGGGAVGREGPTIQIAATIFRKVNAMLPAWWPKVAKKNMIVAGASAGLAAAFNTPIGGIIFAVEELTKTHISFFKTALFSAVIIAGLTAQIIAGPYLYIGESNAEGSSIYAFVGLIIVAIISGLCASIMCKLMLYIFRWKRIYCTKNIHHILFLIITGFLLAYMAFAIDWHVLGSGKELMTQLLTTSNKYQHWYTPLLRIIGPIISFTSGGAGGVFAPALSAGANIGVVIAHLFGFADANTNLLILVGMAAFLTGVTRSPFTSAILVLEMTDRHSIIFQLMLAAMISSIVSLIIDTRSFYDHLKLQYVNELE